MLNLAKHVCRRAADSPSRLAVASEGRELTYAELGRRAGNLAHALRAHLALDGRRGSRKPLVGVVASRSIEACVAVLGCAWAGATYVPIGTRTPEERLRRIASVCQLSALVADDQGARLLTRTVLPSLAPRVVVVPRAEPVRDAAAGLGTIVVGAEELEGDGPLPELAPFEPDDLAYVMFTSGTTGVPKGVMISSARSADAFIEMIGPRLGLCEDDRTLEVTELGFDVSVMNMFATWRAGASLHVLPATKITNAVRFARERRLTVWSSTPSLIALLAQMKQLSPGALPDVRLAVFIGEPLSRGTLATWSAAAPNGVVEDLYGPTEATVVCTGQRITSVSGCAVTPDRDVLSIGTPLSGSEVAIVSDALGFLPPGEIGELALSGVQLARGYLGAPELTERKFPVIDGKRWYLTGDSAYRDADGLFHHLGRLDNQVKILGNRVELEEIEAHIRDVTEHELVAVLPWPTVDGMHQGLVAFVCGARRDTLMPALERRVPSCMLPSRVHWVEQMPVNQSGKIDRHALTDELRRRGT